MSTAISHVSNLVHSHVGKYHSAAHKRGDQLICEGFLSLNWVGLCFADVIFPNQELFKCTQAALMKHRFAAAAAAALVRRISFENGRCWTWREYGLANSLTQGEMMKLNVKVIMANNTSLAENGSATVCVPWGGYVLMRLFNLIFKGIFICWFPVHMTTITAEVCSWVLHQQK